MSALKFDVLAHFASFSIIVQMDYDLSMYTHTHTSLRTYVSSRPLFQELNTLLAYLGAPTYRRKRTLANAHSTLIGSQLEEFLDSMANECDEKTLRNLKAKEVFYQVRREGQRKEKGWERVEGWESDQRGKEKVRERKRGKAD